MKPLVTSAPNRQHVPGSNDISSCLEESSGNKILHASLNQPDDVDGEVNEPTRMIKSSSSTTAMMMELSALPVSTSDGETYHSGANDSIVNTQSQGASDPDDMEPFMSMSMSMPVDDPVQGPLPGEAISLVSSESAVMSDSSLRSDSTKNGGSTCLPIPSTSEQQPATDISNTSGRRSENKATNPVLSSEKPSFISGENNRSSKLINENQTDIHMHPSHQNAYHAIGNSQQTHNPGPVLVYPVSHENKTTLTSVKQTIVKTQPPLHQQNRLPTDLATQSAPDSQKVNLSTTNTQPHRNPQTVTSRPLQSHSTITSEPIKSIITPRSAQHPHSQNSQPLAPKNNLSDNDRKHGAAQPISSSTHVSVVVLAPNQNIEAGDKNPLLSKNQQHQQNHSAPSSFLNQNTLTLRSSSLPQKCITFKHLRKKYSAELEYMLVEFRKLQRQLLSGFSGLDHGGVEAKGSRERREKLQSFILHIEDTASQIDLGCLAQQRREDESVFDDMTPNNEDEEQRRKRIEEEESVKELEEHILTNLLPVKTRLVKQLSAQGRTIRANAAMKARSGVSSISSTSSNVPIPRGYPQPRHQGPATFASGSSSLMSTTRATSDSPYSMGPPQYGPITVESQYGRPIGGNGSSLTKKLHGKTLGKTSSQSLPKAASEVTTEANTARDDSLEAGSQTVRGSTVNDTNEGSPDQKKRKIFYAGMAPGSDIKSKLSSVAAAAGSEVPDTNQYETQEMNQDYGIINQESPNRMLPPPPVRDNITQPSEVEHALKTTQGLQSQIDPQNHQQSHNKHVSQGNHHQVPTSSTQPPKQSNASKKFIDLAQKPTSSTNHPQTISKTAPLHITIDATTRISTLESRPASAAADAIASVVSRKNPTPQNLRPAHEHKSESRHLESAPVQNSSNNDAKDILERRKRCLRRRRRRRKRREARLYAATEALQISSPHIFCNNYGNSSSTHSSNPQYVKALHQSGAHNIIDRHHSGAMNKSAKAGGGNSANQIAGGQPHVRTVEYICALCNEQYAGSCECNPWWALTQKECPKCRKSQIPRIDITAAANAVEYHPALLAHAEEANGGSSNTSSNSPGAGIRLSSLHKHVLNSHTTSNVKTTGVDPNDSDPDLLNEDDNGLDDDDDVSSGESANEDPCDEDFGKDYSGPKLDDEDVSKLLVLIEHASTCPGRHKSLQARQVCQNVKYMMLHARDCPGITLTTGHVCPFPWCRKVKHMLYHLVSCTNPATCKICNPTQLPPNLLALKNLNIHRRKKQQEKARKSQKKNHNGSKVTGKGQENVDLVVRHQLPPRGAVPTSTTVMNNSCDEKVSSSTEKGTPQILKASNSSLNDKAPCPQQILSSPTCINSAGHVPSGQVKSNNMYVQNPAQGLNCDAVKHSSSLEPQITEKCACCKKSPTCPNRRVTNETKRTEMPISNEQQGTTSGVPNVQVVNEKKTSDLVVAPLVNRSVTGAPNSYMQQQTSNQTQREINAPARMNDASKTASKDTVPIPILSEKRTVLTHNSSSSQRGSIELPEAVPSSDIGTKNMFCAPSPTILQDKRNDPKHVSGTSSRQVITNDNNESKKRKEIEMGERSAHSMPDIVASVSESQTVEENNALLASRTSVGLPQSSSKPPNSHLMMPTRPVAKKMKSDGVDEVMTSAADEPKKDEQPLHPRLQTQVHPRPTQIRESDVTPVFNRDIKRADGSEQIALVTVSKIIHPDKCKSIAISSPSSVPG